MKFPAKTPSSPRPEIHTPISADSAETQARVLSRPDYDLHPLIVNGLEHYLDLEDSECRFHIR